MSNDTRSGGCLCGKVRYQAPARPLSVAVCHCRDCQKQSGSALSVIAVFARGDVAFEGELSVYEGRGESGGKVERVFCGACGSPIYSNTAGMEARGIIAVKAGTLDDVSDLKPAVHVWARSRQPWYQLPEGVPCLETEA